MHNELFTIGPFTVYGYGLMIAIGILSAYLLAEYRAKKIDGLDSERVFGLTCSAVVGGVLGGKVLYYITILSRIIDDPSLIYKNITTGFVIYGALIGGFLGIWLYCRYCKLKLFAYLDLALPSVALAQGFGRIGCFLAGCCYGEETDSAFSIVFTNSAYAPNGVALVPTQLISSALNFLHFAFLVLYAKKWKKADGQVTGLYFMCYSAGRFVIEFFRGDVSRGMIGFLSTSQFIAIFAFAFGMWMYIYSSKRAASTEEGQSFTVEGEDGPTTVFVSGKSKSGMNERERRLAEFAESLDAPAHTAEEMRDWLVTFYNAQLVSDEESADVQVYRIVPGEEGTAIEVSLDIENDEMEVSSEFTGEEERNALSEIINAIYFYRGVSDEDKENQTVRFMTLAATLGQL